MARAPVRAPVPARILDGKRVAETIRNEVADRVAQMRPSGVVPGLSVVLVGDDPASAIYVRNKDRAAREVGIRAETLRLPAETTEAELLAAVARLNRDASVHAILVQLPLPPHIDSRNVLLALDPAKDVDGFHPMNQGLLLSGTPRFAPCTPRGVVELLLRTGIEVAGRHVTILGRSNIVGKPLAALLLQRGPAGDATVTVCHSRSRDLAALAARADILVAAIGQAEFVTANMVKPGATVIDVGINRLSDGRVVGDVAFEAVREVAGAITPVPGGIGPMTIAMLLANTADAAEQGPG